MYARRRAVVLVIAVLVLAASGVAIAAGLGAFNGPKPLTAAQITRENPRYRSSAERDIARLAEAGVAVALPNRAGEPAPKVPAHLFRDPTGSHVVFGYLPYWTLDEISAADIDQVSTLAYFGLSLTGAGSLLESGPGWSDLSSAALASLIGSAHRQKDRVLLTISTTSMSTIDALLASPAASGTRLAAALAGLAAAHGFDGIDIDIEGRGEQLRSAFVVFFDAFATAMRADAPHDELVLNTYPQSAAGGQDFFDVPLLARAADELFVMAYDMDNPSTASANDPLLAPSLGLSDVQSLMQYTKVVPRDKIVLGMPFYGYDFTTSSSRRAATAITASPDAVLYSSIATDARAARWDLLSATPYATFQSSGEWHQTWYDDPISLAIKTSLAADFRIAGVGTWALGFEGDHEAMLSALTGASPPRR